MAAFEPSRAAITTKEAVFRVFIQEKMKHLHTGQFKQVYKEVKTPLPHVNFLILGFLVWLEQHYLDYTIKANLDSAIDDYHKQMDLLENDKNLWGRYTTYAGRSFPLDGLIIIQRLSRNETHEYHESQGNKDVVLPVRD